MESKLVKSEDIIKNGTDAQAEIVEATENYIKTLQKYDATYFLVTITSGISNRDLGILTSSSDNNNQKTSEERQKEFVKINHFLLTLGANLVIVPPSLVRIPNEPNDPN